MGPVCFLDQSQLSTILSYGTRDSLAALQCLSFYERGSSSDDSQLSSLLSYGDGDGLSNSRVLIILLRNNGADRNDPHRSFREVFVYLKGDGVSTIDKLNSLLNVGDAD